MPSFTYYTVARRNNEITLRQPGVGNIIGYTFLVLQTRLVSSWEPNKGELNFQYFFLGPLVYHTTAQQRATPHWPRQAVSGVHLSHQPICVRLFSMVISV